MLTQVLFCFLAATAVASAIGVVVVRNVVHGALLLGLCLTMVGGLYGILGADFLFGAQILIYVGAIAILFLFVVLLSGRRAEFAEKPLNAMAPQAALAAFLIFALVGGILAQVREALHSLPPAAAATTSSVGDLILGRYAIAVEVLGLILLVALVGATLMARGLDKERV
ncbi:MAG: NADH-quinone oxidoreductase subunit J [Elusimicrobia bacterium]|nr:NADH-quinone oxidoreductase subunit J [Elusimicrobiota bacterium]